MWIKKRISLPLTYRIAKELVTILGTIELILGVYIGYQFGAEATLKAWLWVGVLVIVSASSTRLWIWVLERMTHKVN